VNKLVAFATDARKTVVSLAVGVAGIAGQVLAANVVHGTALHYTQVILAVATAIATAGGVYKADNGNNAPSADGGVVDPTVATAPPAV
jgi:hypothetical protein